MTSTLLDRWNALDPGAPAEAVWCRPVAGDRAVVLLGAFDPPTRAHLAVATAASRAEGVPAALCCTRVLLARPGGALLAPHTRLELLQAITRRLGLGFVLANRGTYIEVGRALERTGISPTFVVGSDKLGQLADPTFYPDAERGVSATFSELDLLVVPRRGHAVDRDDVRILDPRDVFEGSDLGDLSATQVRDLVRSGRRVDHLVPPEVAVALGGYTSAR